MANKTDKKMGFCIKRHKIILMNCMDYNYFFSKMIISLGYSRVEVAVDVVARSEATRQSHNIARPKGKKCRHIFRISLLEKE